MKTPPPPRLKIHQDKLHNMTIEDVVNLVPKSWKCNKFDTYFGLI